MLWSIQYRARKSNDIHTREQQHYSNCVSSPFGFYSCLYFIIGFRWTYQSSSQLRGSSSSGLISRYGGGGYVQDLTPNHPAADAELKDLYENLWLDRGTRVVFLDFTVYNANINLFCQIKLTVEFPASGGAVPSKSFSTTKLIRVRFRIEIIVSINLFPSSVCLNHGLLCLGLWGLIHHLYGLLYRWRNFGSKTDLIRFGWENVI